MQLVLGFEAVSVSDIVGIELLQPNEDELVPGTWVHIDIVGVTEEGTHVANIHPRFEVGEDSHVGYFAYEYDPDAPSQTLYIEALGLYRRTSFRGVSSRVNKPDLACVELSVPQKRNRPALFTTTTGF